MRTAVAPQSRTSKPARDLRSRNAGRPRRCGRAGANRLGRLRRRTVMASQNAERLSQPGAGARETRSHQVIRRATLIVNPCSHRVTEERLRSVERELGRVGELTVVRTQRRGHATELAREAEGDAIFAYGGDGLFNEVLNGASGAIPVGFVPGGHTNVLARALGLPRDPVAASARLVAARPRRISLGKVNGRRFGFSSGVGVGAEAVRRRRRGRVRGRARRGLGARALTRQPDAPCALAVNRRRLHGRLTGGCRSRRGRSEGSCRRKSRHRRSTRKCSRAPGL